MEKEFWILMLRWAMAIAAEVFAGSKLSDEEKLLKENTENFISRCEENK